MSTWYGGDYVPYWFTNFGPGSMAAYSGCAYSFTKNSVWFEELENKSWENIERHLDFNNENSYWQLTLRTLEAALEAAQGQYLVSVPDIGGNLDILVSLIGNDKLLLDLYDNPKKIKEIEAKACQLWFQYYEACRNILSMYQGDETCAWLPAYYNGKWYPMQCDFSVMISPDMFKDFVSPRLIETSNRLGHSIYHWDGPGQLIHAKHIAEIKNINMCQFVSLPDDPPACSVHYLEHYKIITDSGKGLHLHVPLHGRNEAIELKKKLPNEKLMFHAMAKNEIDGREILIALS
jgi:5-methyltetrahydrofolate--homocysteine methyltransferase